MKIVVVILLLASALCLCAGDPSLNYDLNAITPQNSGEYTRIHGYTGNGAAGVPVCGGYDINADGFADTAFAQFQSSPNQTLSGEVTLILGNGGFGEVIDSSIDSNRIVRIFGRSEKELTGSEIWMDDINGDGHGDLIICRQNFTPVPVTRVGAGAVTVILGGPAMEAQAQSLQPIDLSDPPTNGVTRVEFHGIGKFDRLGIWLRTGDVNGDGIADIVVGADQEDHHGLVNTGGVWVFQGGPHLSTNQVINLEDFQTASDPHPGRIAHILPPVSSSKFHFGGTVNVADLDGNGRAEILAAATINRAGAAIGAPGAFPQDRESFAGAPQGKAFVVWDDNFTLHPDGSFSNVTWVIDQATGPLAEPGNTTVIQGASSGNVGGKSFRHTSFGEELLGGMDYNGDGQAEFFSGDLSGRANGRGSAGVGHVFYNIQDFRTAPDIDLDNPPANMEFTLFLGPVASALGSDTVAQGDFDLDGLGDLMIGNPHDDPVGRNNAGSMHVFYGQLGGWPQVVDTLASEFPGPEVLRSVLIPGALANDVLCYSAASGDLNGDGRTDLFANEMTGDGLNGAQNVGNFVLIDGAALLQPAATITSAVYTGPAQQDFGLSFNTVPGATYRVQRNTDLLSTNWVDVVTGIPGSGNATNVVDQGAAAALPRAFYRIGAE